ncbi:MAG TPA: hypothetical protein VK501_16015 [Baekduia sp.]|uniref:hypothetical protein n=1 Tax=Baekduia sp. TaxID=2600305 RepID=UPI002BC49C6E|nr:hypothetical protein [Baekduia sp.]HMJ35415.1 hypothetical protein [Baekduia sp.]
MGTSADFGGQTGGAWKTYKTSAFNYARFGGEKHRKKVIKNYAAAALGGGGGGGGGGATGGGGGGGAGGLGGLVPAAQTIGAFGTRLAEDGLDAALEEVGLGHLVGSDRWDVMDGLMESLIGDGSTLDEAAATSAIVQTLEQIFPDGADTYEELSAATLDAAGVKQLVEKFFGNYIYNHMGHTLGKYLQNCEPAQAQEREAEMRDTAHSLFSLQLGDRDPLTIDWKGPEGKAEVEAVIAEFHGYVGDADT